MIAECPVEVFEESDILAFSSLPRDVFRLMTASQVSGDVKTHAESGSNGKASTTETHQLSLVTHSSSSYEPSEAQRTSARIVPSDDSDRRSGSAAPLSRRWHPLPPPPRRFSSMRRHQFRVHLGPLG